jgi:lipid II:glycine glycyltransferase (peptidoglycan interpeptide bridge formation enzyme)
MRLLVAERKNDKQRRLIAGSIFLKFGQTVFYAFTGCAPQDLRLHPHDIIQIDSIRDACKDGFRWYDFGEVSEDNESLAQFKGKWGRGAKASVSLLLSGIEGSTGHCRSTHALYPKGVERFA